MSSLAEAVGALLGRLVHLEGPLAALLARLLVMLAAMVLAVAAYRACTHLVDRLLRPLEGASDYPAKVQRARTLGPLMKNVARYTLAFVALVIVLREVGIDVQALLVSAGVLGLAVGLGAQTLIKDVITGFFILFEGLIGVGDVIEVGANTGTVEAIGLRVTKLRMLNGVGKEWAGETRLALEAPEALGPIRFGESDLGIRLMVKVEAARRFDVEVELRRRIKEAFEREGIPFPQRVVYLDRKAAS